MRGLLARWEYRSDAASRETAASLFLRERILAARGLTDPGTLAAYLDPKLTHLHDPSLIPDLDRAAERILRACHDGEQIVIYGDYDVDGVTGTAILWHMVRAISPQANVRTYVPHRLEEGYGLNESAVRELAGDGAKLLVSVDCGITAIAPVQIASSLGLAVIITDHHNPPTRLDDLPGAFAVVHPRRPDSQYPFKDLSGAGVAYKLAWRLATMHAGGRHTSPELRGLLVDLLAFASLGTIADIVPLHGENRVLARHGLVRCRHSRFVGLNALVEASGLAGEDIDAMAVGFRLGPRLNAAGRMGHAREANELFTTTDADRAKIIAAQLSKQNRERQEAEQRILDQADEMAVKLGMTGADGHRAIVLVHRDWHAGVVGIVCSRLVERHHRPVILLCLSDDSAHGSGRSIEGFNLHGALADCSHLLDKFGGHDMAAGLRVSAANLPAFIESFLAIAAGTIEPERLCKRLRIDCDATVDELTVSSVKELEALQPCGAGNPTPIVRVQGAVVADRPMPMGSEGRHIAVLVQSTESQRPVRAVGWGFGQHRERFVPGQRLDLVVKPRISTWQGASRVEPELVDFALSVSPEPE